MTPEELQSLWQSQPSDPTPVQRSNVVPFTDVAAPTQRPSRVRPVLAAAVTLSLAAAAIALLSTGPRTSTPPPELPSLPPIARTEADREQLLSECRVFSSPENPNVDYARAERACTDVLEDTPAHTGALELVASIKKRRACATALEEATTAAEHGQHELAVERFGAITDACPRELKLAFEPARASYVVAVGNLRERCASALTAKQPEDVSAVCTEYARFLCLRKPGADELTQRADAFLASHGMPKPTFQCPTWLALFPPSAPPDPLVWVRAQLERSHPAPRIVEAKLRYLQGDAENAVTLLRAEEGSSAEARPLRLAAEQCVEAMRAFTEATRADDVLAANAALSLLEEGERTLLPEAVNPTEETRRGWAQVHSRFRSEALRQFSRLTYALGREKADRKDFRAACRLWKLGLQHSRASLDLLKAATNVCTPKAGFALDTATTCEALDVALDFAVDGDGYAEKISDAKLEADCR